MIWVYLTLHVFYKLIDLILKSFPGCGVIAAFCNIKSDSYPVPFCELYSVPAIFNIWGALFITYFREEDYAPSKSIVHTELYLEKR